MAIVVLHIPTGEEVIVPSLKQLKDLGPCTSALATKRCHFTGVCKDCFWFHFTLDNPEFVWYHKDL